MSINRYAYVRNNPLLRIDVDGKVDTRTDEDKFITESSAVLVTSSKLADSVSSGFEYGALVGQASDGSVISTDIYTSNNPQEVSHRGAVEQDPQGNWVIKGTGVEPIRSMHTHLTSGRKYPVPGTGQFFTPTATTQPSQGDLNNAQATGVSGYILVPSKRVLVKFDSYGSYQILLSKKDYRSRMKRARKELKHAKK